MVVLPDFTGCEYNVGKKEPHAKPRRRKEARCRLPRSRISSAATTARGWTAGSGRRHEKPSRRTAFPGRRSGSHHLPGTGLPMPDQRDPVSRSPRLDGSALAELFPSRGPGVHPLDSSLGTYSSPPRAMPTGWPFLRLGQEGEDKQHHNGPDIDVAHRQREQNVQHDELPPSRLLNGLGTVRGRSCVPVREAV